jgi:CheY-like chemotaxis protein
VEDEDAVRRVARIALETSGYRVLEASRGGEAVRLAHEHPGPIHLLVSDVVMPEMGGHQLADAIRASRPGLRGLFMSGDTDTYSISESMAAVANGDAAMLVGKKPTSNEFGGGVTDAALFTVLAGQTEARLAANGVVYTLTCQKN